MNEFQSPEQTPTRPGTSGLATASLVLGICGFVTCAVTGVVGLILGIVSLNEIKKSAGRLKGKGIAIAGIVFSAASIVWTMLLLLLMALLMPALAHAKVSARSIMSMNNVKQLCISLIMYSDDHDGLFPPAENWTEAIAGGYAPDPGRMLASPFETNAGRAYAMNANLGRKKMQDIRNKARTVMLFECRFGSPPAGGPELLPARPRGPRGYVIGFLDGHVETVRPERLDRLIWQP